MMNKFLKNIGLFCVIGVGICMAHICVNTWIIQHKFKIQPTRVLIVGDSYPEKAINPNLFESANNIAQSAEPYMITFKKLKRVLKEINPDTIILGFSYHNISAFNDYKLVDSKFSSEMFKRYYSVLDFRELKVIDIDYKAFVNVYFKHMALYPNKRHFKFIGKYSNSKVSRISDSLKAIKRHYYRDERELSVSETSINYLDSIIDICQKNNIEPILVNSPVNQAYKKLIPDLFVNRFKSLEKRLRSKNLTIYNFGNTFYADSLYLNSDHLNSYGADQFTNSLLDSLKAN